MANAPIALFVYSRPWHTRQTIEALKKNDLSEDSELFIFSDAPKSASEATPVQDVRDYIRTVKGFRTVKVIEREENYGLARSIVEGVTRLCNEYGSVIVLEDDLVSSPHFLRFMNNALHQYSEAEKVMHISGYAYPVHPPVEGDTFFFRVPLCWGWATWSSSWKFFEKDLNVIQAFTKRDRFEFNIEDSYRKFWEQLELNRAGSLNSWFIFWYASVFLHDGLCLYPTQSLIDNIGHDGSGINCGTNDLFRVSLADKPVPVKTIPVTETRAVLTAHKKYFRKIVPPLINRITGKIWRKFMRGLNALRS